MNKTVLRILMFVCFTIQTANCKAQGKLIEMTVNTNLNYYFSNISEVNVINHSLFSRAMFLNVYTVNDAKATPDDYFEGYDGVLQSLFIAVKPDGDYYSWSKLYKIESILNPKIITINELKYPKFEIVIEFGNKNNRSSKSFFISPVKD